MKAYEFNADVQGNIIKIPEHIMPNIPSKFKVMILFDEMTDSKDRKWDFAIPHDKFWAKLGITPETDLSDVEEYEIE